MRSLLIICAGVLLASSGGVTSTAQAALAADEPDFHEVYDLVRSHLPGVSEAELSRAAIQGLLERFPAQVTVETNVAGADQPAPTDGPLLSHVQVFDGAYGYLRIHRVAAGLAQAVQESYTGLRATNRLKGLVLDLRYAGGRDYRAAAQTADDFIAEARPLLDWGDGLVRSTAKTNAIPPPVAILVNGETAGAAEALAAVLRAAEVGLVIGTPTAGRAQVFQEFSLKTGQRLRVATLFVTLGDGQRLPASGLTPDIRVQIPPADEQKYFADAYRTLRKPSRAPATDAGSEVDSTNPAPRLNEAELVRLKREGLDPLATELRPAPRAVASTRPLVRDPALARALDLLKGLAVVRQSPQAGFRR